MSHAVVHVQPRESYLHWNSVCINRCGGTTGLWEDWKVQLNIHDILKAQFIAAGTQIQGENSQLYIFTVPIKA